MDSTILNKFLTEMGEMLKEAKDFSLQQLPIVAKEILSYHLAVSAMWTIVGIISALLCLRMWKWCDKIVKEDSGNQPVYMVPFFGIIVSTVVILCNLSNVLKIYLAPRVYLLEYIATLLHTSK